MDIYGVLKSTISKECLLLSFFENSYIISLSPISVTDGQFFPVSLYFFRQREYILI